MVTNTTVSQFEQELWEYYNRLNKAPLATAIGEAAVGIVQDNFEAEGRPEKWAPLSDSWLKEKTALGKAPAGILRLYGHLESSIEYEISNNEINVGTNVEYASLHQFGGISKQENEIPARPFLVIPDSELHLLYEQVSLFFDSL